MTISEFPILDADRSTATAEYGRVVCDVFVPVEPHMPELDNWVALPVRLARSQANGWYLEPPHFARPGAVLRELGPYNLNAADVRSLRQAIAAYDTARGAC